MTHLDDISRTESAARATRVSGVVSGIWRWMTRRGPERAEPKKLGPYVIERKLGEGGMGVVYKGRHGALGRPAAVKVLAPGRSGEHDLRRFEREAEVTSRLSHPNSISVYDFGRTSDGGFYYAMEYVDGVDLQTLIEREGPQRPARVAHLLAQLASALHEAHCMGLVHRDVKPSNVMVCGDDLVKLLDFGLTKQLDAESDLTLTDPDQLLGTPLYLSPEALTNPNDLDGRADLYALGAVGYFLLTGVPPFTGRSVIEVCGQHLHSEPVPPSSRAARSIPRELEALLLGCLAKNPDQRPRSAAVVARALRAFAEREERRTPAAAA
jgi:serine/threonine-protein kinase